MWTRLKSYLSQLLETRMLVSTETRSGESSTMLTSIGFTSVAIWSIPFSREPVLMSMEESVRQEPVHLSGHAWEQWAQPSDQVLYGDRAQLIAKTSEWQRLKEQRRPFTTHVNEEDLEQGVIFSYMAEVFLALTTNFLMYNTLYNKSHKVSKPYNH